ncbi:MAG: hypothetical protein M3Y49_06135, partial [Actinomycetota bacterium]|nr:hypothetical protein [Actinomycetota bacterium]
MVWHELRRRLGRSLAMGFAVLVAAAGFTVLTSSSDASKLATTGTVQKNSLTSYDVLVRPRGARTAQEVSQQLVQPGFLAGIRGGISTGQWQQILHMSGVQVAAPMSVVGSTVLATPVRVDITKEISRSAPTTLRIVATWHLPDGRAQAQQPSFVYRTARSLSASPSVPSTVPVMCQYPYQSPPMPNNQLISQARGGLDCEYENSNGQISSYHPAGVPPGHSVIELVVPLPQVLVAIDPAQEAKLSGHGVARGDQQLAGLKP